MDKDTAIELPKIPKDKDYEDYLCAFLQAGGLYIEKNIIYRGVEELLELDILTTDFQKDSAENNLVEIKGGDWGFSDIFKIKGWLTYLKYPKGCFIVQKTRPSISYFQDKAKELDVKLIDNSDLTKTLECLQPFFKVTPNDPQIETIRFAYLLERKQLQKIKAFKKSNPGIKGYAKLDDYFFKINSGSFFTRDPIRRINQLFDNFIKFKNISARLCNELEGGEYDDENILQISKKAYKDIFYNAKDSIILVALFIEHLARVTILKCVIEHLIDKLQGNYSDTDVIKYLEYLSLPRTITNGLNDIFRDKYFYLYPRFWQFFTYVFGGFILTALEEKEYQHLSERTGIPVEEIPNAFNAFNKLFPRDGGWFFNLPHSHIKWHSLFPISFSGIGANYRRLIYTQDDTFDSLEKLLPTDKTMADIIKWNNLTYSILK